MHLIQVLATALLTTVIAEANLVGQKPLYMPVTPDLHGKFLHITDIHVITNKRAQSFF